MEIAEQANEHDVTDYDFQFGSGAKLTLTVDHDAGDVAKELDDRFVISIAAKESLSDPDERTDAEVLVVYKINLAFTSIRSRKQRMPSPEELVETRKMIHRMAKTVQ